MTGLETTASKGKTLGCSSPVAYSESLRRPGGICHGLKAFMIIGDAGRGPPLSNTLQLRRVTRNLSHGSRELLGAVTRNLSHGSGELLGAITRNLNYGSGELLGAIPTF